MKSIFAVCLLFLISALCQSATVLISIETQEDFLAQIKDQTVLEVNDFDKKGFRREVVEIILLHQALNLGGYKQKIVHKVKDVSYKRGIRAIESGAADMWGVSVWAQSVVDSNYLYISDPVIELGEYDAVMYTNPSNKKALLVKSREQLQQLSVVSNRNYKIDWLTLSEIGIKKMIHTPVWESMIRFVDSGRADFMIAPLQLGEKYHLTRRYFQGGRYKKTFRLVPIPNVKLYLNDSRHWIVNKQSSGSQEIIDALNKGLAILNESGKRKRALSECGFIRPELQSWTALN